jgi:multiple sugar transport system permease protein
MKPGNTFFIGLFVGALWAMIFSVVISIFSMLVTGETIVPDVGSALVGGAVGAAFYLLTPLGKREELWIPVSAAVAFAVFWLMQKFTGVAAVPTTVQVLTWVGTFLVSAVSWHLCFHDMRAHSQGRYQLEVIFIRVMKGIGFVFFTIVVALPFYVMLMTSVKSQQSLLANPLDLSINIWEDPKKLFRSYIELFTDYRFGLFLLNSAMVSVATVIITLLFSIPGAYAVSRLKFPGQAVLSRSILLIYMVPAIVLVRLYVAGVLPRSAV